VRRNGRPDATVAMAGVTAQKLRHLDVLLEHPWVIRLDQTMGVPLVTPADVRLANPVSFIAQKLLIQELRTPAKQAQDALYVYDTLELFGSKLQRLRSIWRDDVRPSLGRKTAKKVDRLGLEQFEAVTDAISAAVRIPTDRNLTAERLRAACAFGLAEIFGTD
jgi:hypothetical protein